MREKQPLQVPEDMELLVRNNGRHKAHGAAGGVSLRVKVYLSLLCCGLVSTGLCLWVVIYTRESEKIAEGLGMSRVANSLENILNLLALPTLMFTVIVSIYAAQRLYRLYRVANDPAAYRRK